MYWLNASKKGTLSDRFIGEQTYIFSYDDEKSHYRLNVIKYCFKLRTEAV